MRTHLLGLVIVLLGSATAAAQGPGKPGGLRVACPTTLNLNYTQVDRLDFGGPADPKLDITGWQPRFAPAAVRLIEAGVNEGANDKGEVSNVMPDNGDSAKPGEPLVWTIWTRGQKKPDFAAHVMCSYEGGFAIQQALPSTIRVCSLRTKERKPTASETTTRTFLTAAEFSCR